MNKTKIFPISEYLVYRKQVYYLAKQIQNNIVFITVDDRSSDAT